MKRKGDEKMENQLKKDGRQLGGSLEEDKEILSSMSCRELFALCDSLGIDGPGAIEEFSSSCIPTYRGIGRDALRYAILENLHGEDICDDDGSHKECKPGEHYCPATFSSPETGRTSNFHGLKQCEEIIELKGFIGLLRKQLEEADEINDALRTARREAIDTAADALRAIDTIKAALKGFN
jgi:hypothetical protein